MACKTLYLSQPAKLKLKNSQLHITLFNPPEERTISLEELDLLILDHTYSTLTLPLLSAITSAHVAVIICNNKHLPQGLLLPITQHHIVNQRVQLQASTPLPLKKQLWKKIIQEKIIQQARLLHYTQTPHTAQKLRTYATQVKSNDTTKREAIAAQHYWPTLMGKKFIRHHRHSNLINQALNYGYAIIRGAIARALTASGLLPILGLHHHNKYNPHPLADDIMEPYRPFVDQKVYNEISQSTNNELTLKQRASLVKLLHEPCKISDKITTIDVAIQTTSNSLVQALQQKKPSQLTYPQLLPIPLQILLNP